MRRLAGNTKSFKNCLQKRKHQKKLDKTFFEFSTILKGHSRNPQYFDRWRVSGKLKGTGRGNKTHKRAMRTSNSDGLLEHGAVEQRLGPNRHDRYTNGPHCARHIDRGAAQTACVCTDIQHTHLFDSCQRATEARLDQMEGRHFSGSQREMHTDTTVNEATVTRRIKFKGADCGYLRRRTLVPFAPWLP